MGRFHRCSSPSRRSPGREFRHCRRRALEDEPRGRSGRRGQFVRRNADAPRLSALGSRLSALGSRLSALGSRLSALGSRLSALGSRLSALGSRLSALGSRLSALGSRLSALGSRLSALGSRLSALGSLYLWEDPCPPAPARASAARANLRPHPPPRRAHAPPPSHRQRGSSLHSCRPCRCAALLRSVQPVPNATPGQPVSGLPGPQLSPRTRWRDHAGTC